MTMDTGCLFLKEDCLNKCVFSLVLKLCTLLEHLSASGRLMIKWPADYLAYQWCDVAVLQASGIILH